MSKRILVVEDQEDNRQIVRDLLTVPGSRASDGRARAVAPVAGSPAGQRKRQGSLPEPERLLREGFRQPKQHQL